MILIGLRNVFEAELDEEHLTQESVDSVFGDLQISHVDDNDGGLRSEMDDDKRNSCSKLCSCSMKWKFGAMFDLRERTRQNASLSDSECFAIKYATVIVTERDTPAKQWTSTPLS